MDGIAAASGSACTSGALERSHVLRAMHLPDEQIQSAVRFSFGLGNTLEELEEAAHKVGTIVRRIRNNY
jgi:cysteine desulfurase